MAFAKNVVSSNYNTRRKSLSLSSMGIALPVSHASRSAMRSPPSAVEAPPMKKMKRLHSDDHKSQVPPAKRHASKSSHEQTPPPSPEAISSSERGMKPKLVNSKDIGDEIVESVINQLQQTGNKPQLVKQLAELLHDSVKIVEQSANPSAIVSSRLSSFLKRPCWTNAAPCPLAKELETIHPRRTYFYLTTCPRQPIPESIPSDLSLRSRKHSLTTPPLSSAHSRTDEVDAERRRELSPSPEVDLSAPEFDDDLSVDDASMISPPTPTGSFTSFPGHFPPAQSQSSSINNRNRATSPPLEDIEKQFELTANGMSDIRKKLSNNTTEVPPPSSAVAEMSENKSHENDEHNLFGFGVTGNLNGRIVNVSAIALSPALRPTKGYDKKLEATDLTRLDADVRFVHWGTDIDTESWDMRSPEHVDLQELDGMFEDF